MTSIIVFFTSNLYFLTSNYYNKSNISVITKCSSLYLVSLRMLILLSSCALVRKRVTAFPLSLTPHIYRREWASIHTRGISLGSSTWNSSLKSFRAEILGSCAWNMVRSCCPISLDQSCDILLMQNYIGLDHHVSIADYNSISNL